MLFTLGNIRWYILEGEKTNNDFTLYGIVVGLACAKFELFQIYLYAIIQNGNNLISAYNIHKFMLFPFVSVKLSTI